MSLVGGAYTVYDENAFDADMSSNERANEWNESTDDAAEWADFV